MISYLNTILVDVANGLVGSIELQVKLIGLQVHQDDPYFHMEKKKTLKNQINAKIPVGTYCY